MSDGPNLSGWRFRTVIVSVVVSAQAYLGFSLWVGWEDVGSAFGRVGAAGMALVLLMSMLNYGLRFLRWQRYLTVMGHEVPWRPSLTIYLAGFALTTTPGKAGEALRGLMLKPWGVPYSRSLAALFSERLSDLSAIVLLALLGLTEYPHSHPVIISGIALVVAALLMLSNAGLMARLGDIVAKKPGKLSVLLQHALQILLEARRCHRPSVLVVATVLSVIAWSAEAIAFHWILQWMGADIPLSFAVFVYAVSMLAGALSFMPGGLGGAEAAMVSLLIWKGMPKADAVAAALLIRLATLWFAVAIGALMIGRKTMP